MLVMMYDFGHGSGRSHLWVEQNLTLKTQKHDWTTERLKRIWRQKTCAHFPLAGGYDYLALS